jgi:ferredoxin
MYHVIDADEDIGMSFCKEMNVKSLPTTFMYEDDKIVKVINGVKNLEEYV